MKKNDFEENFDVPPEEFTEVRIGLRFSVCI